MKLYTSDEDFDILHKAVDKARKNAKDIKVSRQSLLNVLMDHSHFITALKQHTDGLYIAVYLNTGDSIKSICKLSLDDLVLDYVKSSTHNNLISERDFSELYTEINSSLMILEELIDDDFPDSGFTDDFSTTH